MDIPARSAARHSTRLDGRGVQFALRPTRRLPHAEHAPRCRSAIGRGGRLGRKRRGPPVGRTASGDLQAFEQLYRVYHPRLSRFLDGMMRRPGLVGEVLNDTMLVVWNRPQATTARARSRPGSSRSPTATRSRPARATTSRSRTRTPTIAAPPEAGPEQQLRHRQQTRAALAQAMDALSASSGRGRPDLFPRAWLPRDRARSSVARSTR